MSCFTPLHLLLHLEEEIQHFSVKVVQLVRSALAFKDDSVAPQKTHHKDIKGKGNIFCKLTHAALLPK